MSSPTTSTAADFFYPPKPTFTFPSDSTHSADSIDEHSAETTVILQPSNGSTCVSLYPRTKSFTLHTKLDSRSFLATSDYDIWRITQDSEAADGLEEPRFTFERLGSLDSSITEDITPLEVFKRCKVDKLEKNRRGSQRRISIGNYSSGYSGLISPVRSLSISSSWSSAGSPTRY